MGVALVTGSAGLIGSEAVRFFAAKGFDIVGIDNDMRAYFFGDEASTRWNREQLEKSLPEYRHFNTDIRDFSALKEIFKTYGKSISIIIHTAAQPSHDWAAREPMVDFSINTNGTMNLLELMRDYCPEATFIFTSTNKVYGDTPNALPLLELETRYELDKNHAFYAQGIDEGMRIDQTLHSLFGVSKTAADLLVQEYGRYFGLKTVCFRGGCLTGPRHSGTQLHGFLAYLVKCALEGTPYQVFGYHGKQVRDNIHSFDLINAFWQFYQNPHPGEVYNMGGGRHSNCSILEAIPLISQITGHEINWSYHEANRVGDHIWWISDTRKFQSHYPAWKQTYNVEQILREIYDELSARPKATASVLPFSKVAGF